LAGLLRTAKFLGTLKLGSSLGFAGGDRDVAWSNAGTVC
jgi:hypothetical protein